jgi:hypothetical protein
MTGLCQSHVVLSIFLESVNPTLSQLHMDGSRAIKIHSVFSKVDGSIESRSLTTLSGHFLPTKGTVPFYSYSHHMHLQMERREEVFFPSSYPCPYLWRDT